MLGTVAASGLRPWMDLSVLGERGRTIEVRAVVDTGCTADLLLPADLVEELALTPREVRTASQADGGELSVRTYAGGRVVWQGSVCDVLVLESGVGAAPLLGMGLMIGSEIRVEARPGGDVVITELS